ncbi:ATP-dependent RNA helicase DDX55/SPB4 [Enteropsectra breve]|nr:ATP-dependent RNA helicase DDX55/SPB4 [Enteropsectra breve]
MKYFSDLAVRDYIKNALIENKFTVLTPTQEAVIPVFLDGKDVVVQSQTGSGKTLAFLVPILQRLVLDAKNTQALIIAPTRELSLQIQEVSRIFGVPSECFIGGSPIEQDYERLNSLLAIATPGRLLELILYSPKAFQKIKFLVLDESDKLLSAGFEAKLLKIISMLPKARQTGLFSATVSDELRNLSIKAMRNPVDIKINEEMPSKLALNFLISTPRDKIRNMINTVQDKRSIVFFSTCAQVDFYYELLCKYFNGEKNISKIHGKLEQDERNLIYEAFHRNGGILLCTDVAARGIDFKGIEMVLHFDVPKDHQNIVHRSGRTARNGSEGESLLFLMPNEKTYVNYLKVNKIEMAEKASDDTLTDRSNSEDLIYMKCKELINEEILQLSVKAFVSYIRSYKEHIVNYILDLKELDFDSLAELFFLEKIPSMKELQNVKFKNYEHIKKPRDENKNTKKSKKEHVKNTKDEHKNTKRFKKTRR